MSTLPRLLGRRDLAAELGVPITTAAKERI